MSSHYTPGLQGGESGTIKKVLIAVAVVTAVIGIIGLIVVTCVQERVTDIAWKHGLVIDSGSSSTKFYYYRWDGEKENGTGAVEQVGYCKNSASSLDDYENKTSEAADSLGDCLDDAELGVPTSRADRSDIPVYLGATAGMRLLNVTNPTAVEEIFDTLRQYLNTTGFEFTEPTQQARILDGGEEGSFAWVSVNYAAGTLYDSDSDEIIGSDADDMVGALDMGGGSTQITFIPANVTDIPVDHSQLFRLYGQNYTVYTMSYLCYGKDEADRRYLATLAYDAGVIAVDAACLADGVSINYTASELFYAPCTSGSDGETYWGFTLGMPSGIDDDDVITFTGTSNYDQCLATVASLFDTTCDAEPCSFNNVYSPAMRGHFYAFSDFYYTFSFLSVDGEASTTAMADTLGNITAWCGNTWTEAQAYDPDATSQYLRWYCFDAVYQYYLLTNGYGFDNSSWGDIDFVSDVNGYTIAWSLGLMISESSLIPEEASTKYWKIGSPVFPMLIVFFVALIILAIVLVIVACLCIGRRQHDSKPV